MDRRTFLQISAVSAVSITLPMVYCKPKPNDLLEFPGTLSSICDEKTIRELGQAYLRKFPGENKSSLLQDLLMEGHENKNGTDDSEAIAAMLDKKIHEDFKTSKTVIIKGWVLSITEARQCALYSLTRA
jgi:hypothetical protein